MPINDLFQKKVLLNKIGLGTPQMAQNIRFNQSNPQTPPPNKPPPPPTPPRQPTPPPAKPGCGGCRRKKA